MDDKRLQLFKQLSLITLSEELLLCMDVPSCVLHLLGFIVVHCQATHEMQDTARHTTVSTSSQKLTGKRGGGGNAKGLLGFFLNPFFVGVFQYDSGTPKHALELKKKRSESFF